MLQCKYDIKYLFYCNNKNKNNSTAQALRVELNLPVTHTIFF